MTQEEYISARLNRNSVDTKTTIDLSVQAKLVAHSLATHSIKLTDRNTGTISTTKLAPLVSEVYNLNRGQGKFYFLGYQPNQVIIEATSFPSRKEEIHFITLSDFDIMMFIISLKRITLHQQLVLNLVMFYEMLLFTNPSAKEKEEMNESYRSFIFSVYLFSP